MSRETRPHNYPKGGTTGVANPGVCRREHFPNWGRTFSTTPFSTYFLKMGKVDQIGSVFIFTGPSQISPRMCLISQVSFYRKCGVGHRAPLTSRLYGHPLPRGSAIHTKVRRPGSCEHGRGEWVVNAARSGGAPSALPGSVLCLQTLTSRRPVVRRTRRRCAGCRRACCCWQPLRAACRMPFTSTLRSAVRCSRGQNVFAAAPRADSAAPRTREAPARDWANVRSATGGRSEWVVAGAESASGLPVLRQLMPSVSRVAPRRSAPRKTSA